MYIKKWFQNKVEVRQGFFTFDLNREMDIVKETEKAYQIRIAIESCDGEFDTTQLVWIPKSCTVSNEEHDAEVKAQEERFNAGCERYGKLVEFCKANNVKGVRTGMRTATIMSLVAKAGLVYAN